MTFPFHSNITYQVLLFLLCDYRSHYSTLYTQFFFVSTVTLLNFYIVFLHTSLFLANLFSVCNFQTSCQPQWVKNKLYLYTLQMLLPQNFLKTGVWDVYVYTFLEVGTCFFPTFFFIFSWMNIELKIGNAFSSSFLKAFSHYLLESI